MTKQAIALLPQKDVAIEDGRFFSLSKEPWLRVEGDFGARPFVEIVFRASLLDDPVRPVLRFVTKDRVIDRILPGPVAGAGVWIGALPRGARAILISPTNRPGAFGFAIESLRPVGLVEALARVWRRKPAKLWSYFLPTLFGYRAEAESAIDWASNFEPLDAFENWRARRARPFEPAGLDAPRGAPGGAPRFAILLSGAEATPEQWARTLASIERQSYPSPARLARSEAELLPLLAEADFVAHLRAGDELADHAFAALAARIARAPQTKLIYADELLRTESGLRPRFAPDWSPTLAAARPYFGRCAFYAASTLASESIDAAMRKAPFRLAREEIAHLRRWLLTRDEESEPPIVTPPAPAEPAPSVSIILLTRDRADLLAPCVESVLRLSTHPSFELVIVDNGSLEPETFAIFEKAKKDPRVRVLSRPEPFNFARLNNDAVRASRGEVVLFLNNDTVVVSPDWLETLGRRAMAPQTGAVGALLLYPDGRIQHAGVTIGLGQDAGHFGALVAPEAPSWLGRAGLPHECSAVTAACMALERRKFDVVGGFDEINLPIEFNDTDLCLRLADRDWTSLYEPAARLLHYESASRGSARFRPMSVYAKERDYFRDRWRDAIRDDPYYHPALSLYSRQPALW
ncbi:glycosyltransferase [Methylosinus sp. PW1]|uniref:glycosyltransferase family 2 protein n=1 Tax=Methylosinus sp. PW1 TaxID=107636 RepID=UPI00056CAD47|nr:glycosyltransferase family 2 protein [Methylosinus sp. PW1]